MGCVYVIHGGVHLAILLQKDFGTGQKGNTSAFKKMEVGPLTAHLSLDSFDSSKNVCPRDSAAAVAPADFTEKKWREPNFSFH